MNWLRILCLRMVGSFRKLSLERQLDDELQVHLEMLVEENVRRGMPPEEARYAALRNFGGIEQAKEQYRDQSGITMIETLLQDLRYGLRQMRRSPGLTAVITLSLALGIGANTAVFSVIDAVMLRMLPVKDPQQLAQIGFQGRHSSESFVGESFPYPVFKELREGNEVFTDIAAFDYWTLFDAHPTASDSTPANESMKAQLVSANFFSMLGVDAVIGRTFALDEDNGAGAHPVAVISYGLWTRSFARSPAVLGRKITVGDTPFTIVGVAPVHFTGTNPGTVCDLWIPVSMQAQVAQGLSLTDIDTNWLTLMARLKPGISLEQARAGLDLVYQQTQRQHDLSKWSEQEHRDFWTHHIVLLSAAQGTDYLRKEFRQPLLLLLGMVGLVLLIACTNVANLLLSRASVRQHEIAVRLSLGAGRRRLVRQLLTESVLLAMIGGALGVLFAYWGGPMLVALMSHGQNQLTLNVHPDVRVLAFTAFIAVLTGVAFGLAPALRATRITARPAPRHMTATRAGRRLGAALVVSQVALSLVMVIGAGLLVRTFHNLETLDPGFNRRNVLLFWLDPSKARYKEERAVRVRKEVLEQIQQVPGVRSVSFSFLTPISGGGWDNVARFVEGYTPSPGEDMDIYLNATGTRFFETLGTPILVGRDFGPQDQSGSPLVALINQTMARRFFGRSNPVGKHFDLGPWSDNDGHRGIEIIGVVGDVKYLSLREKVPPTAYLPIQQLPREAVPGGVTVEVSSAVPPLGLVPQIRSLLRSIDARLSPTDVKTLAEQVDQSLYEERMMSALSGFFGVLALLLACIGLYGIMAYAVARRTSEIGIRMALGAERGRILRIVVREALILALLGIIIGVPTALAASRLVAAMLYGLKPTDPVTILAAVGLMSAVAVLAGYLPARRASRVDPLVALRYE
jgi:predicted permease